jgi:trans-2,3-dihydro-3-hydroxyanthranilate isomerase
MAEKRRFPFVQLDVFSSRPLEGNPLAVFTEARGLSDREMQAIAREMNLSETTFILAGESGSAPPASSGTPAFSATEVEQGVRVRIFTVAEELPFAGHPTLGTAAVIHRATGATLVPLRLGAGTIPVQFRDDTEGIFGEMRQRDPEFGAKHSREAIASLIGVTPDAIAGDLPIQTVSTGLPFTIVPLRDLETIRNLRFEWSRVAEYLERNQSHFFYFVTRQTQDPAARLHTRMLFYGGEDPATGSAAGCCAAWAVAHGVIAPEETAQLEQGAECQRPSRIFVRAARSGDRIINVRVGGYVVEIARGEVFL